MPSATFDALAYFEKLKSAGVPEEQARIQANALREIVYEQLVSRSYLDLRLKEPEYKLAIRLGGIVVACTALLLAALPLLVKQGPGFLIIAVKLGDMRKIAILAALGIS